MELKWRLKPASRLLFLLLSLTVCAAAQSGAYQHGSVIRMHMGDCTLAAHGFMASFGGPAGPVSQESCPEYTLLSRDVVYVFVGKSSNELVPLAEIVAFRLQKNELLVRVDDEKRDLKFTIKEMIVRSEWDRQQQHMEEQVRAAALRDASR